MKIEKHLIGNMVLRPRAMGVMEKLGLNYFSSIDTLDLTEDQLLAIDGCGPITAKEILEEIERIKNGSRPTT